MLAKDRNVHKSPLIEINEAVITEQESEMSTGNTN